MGREIEETRLPGVGLCFAFTTSGGRRVSVIHRHGGRREIYVDDPDDPDASTKVLDLDVADTRALGEMLGASQVVREIDRLQEAVEGLAFEWVTVPEEGLADGRTIRDLEIRSRTGATVVAVVRDNNTLYVENPEFAFAAQDTAIVLGTPDTIERASALLES